jgi:hypothetical protein
MRPPLLVAKRLIVLAAILGVPGLQALATAQTPAPTPDVIIFTNGDQLTGTVLRGVGDSIVFKSDMAGEITIPLAKIKELRSTANFAILRKSTPITRKTLPTGTLAVEDKSITLAVPSAPPQTIPDVDLAYIIDAASYNKELTGHHRFRDGWNGAITGGATVVSSTQNGDTLTAGIALIRTVPTVPWLPTSDRTIFNLVETYGKLTQPVIPQTNPPSPDTSVKTSIFHTDLEQDKYLTPHFYLLALTSFDHNFSQGLNLQQLYGGGVGWTVIKTPQQEFDLTGNIHYTKQEFINTADNQNLIAATVGEAYLHNFHHGIVFTESGTFLPAFNNPQAYSANFAAGLALPAYHRFSFNFTATDSYLHLPSTGYKNNSFQFVTGVVYTLH